MTERCKWCGRREQVCNRNDCLPTECKKELVEWIRTHGKRWRSVLRQHWLHDGIELRYLRNAVGPSGLVTIKPPINDPTSIVG